MNGLAQITIAGREVGLKFGMPAIRKIVENMQLFDLTTGNSSNDLGVAHILYWGYVNHCAMHMQQPELAFPAFYDYVETAPESVETLTELQTAITEFEESRYVKAIVENEKKKATISPSTGMKSSLSVSEPSATAQNNTPKQPGGSTSSQQKDTPPKGRTSRSTRG